MPLPVGLWPVFSAFVIGCGGETRRLITALGTPLRRPVHELGAILLNCTRSAGVTGPQSGISGPHCAWRSMARQGMDGCR